MHRDCLTFVQFSHQETVFHALVSPAPIRRSLPLSATSWAANSIICLTFNVGNSWATENISAATPAMVGLAKWLHSGPAKRKNFLPGSDAETVTVVDSAVSVQSIRLSLSCTLKLGNTEPSINLDRGNAGAKVGDLDPLRSGAFWPTSRLELDIDDMRKK